MALNACDRWRTPIGAGQLTAHASQNSATWQPRRACRRWHAHPSAGWPAVVCTDSGPMRRPQTLHLGPKLARGRCHVPPSAGRPAGHAGAHKGRSQHPGSLKRRAERGVRLLALDGQQLAQARLLGPRVRRTLLPRLGIPVPKETLPHARISRRPMNVFSTAGWPAARAGAPPWPARPPHAPLMPWDTCADTMLYPCWDG